MTPGSWARRAGLAGAAVGAVAAGVAVERLTVHRAVRRKARLALDAAGPYGTLRGTPGRAFAEDGTELYFEIEEPAGTAGAEGLGEGAGTRAGTTADADATPDAALDAAPDAASGRAPDPGAGEGTGEEGAAPAPTVVFCHGYCLAQDVWHFQRAALRGKVRTVYWDQRSHGRSGRSRGTEPVTIDLLGRDLRAVLDAAVPHGPIVLVGHSMGGMAMMALADQYPGLIRERVAGTVFIGTSAGRLSELTYGLPEVGAKAFNRLAPGVLRSLGARAELVERGRRVTADLFTGLIKRYSFGSSDIDPAVARFAERLIESVPVDVVAEFWPAFAAHEKTEALARFDRSCPALVMIGDRDRVTPGEHSEAIAEALGGAELIRVPGAGHLLMLERPELVDEHLARLLTRTIRTHGRTADRRSPDHRPHT